MSKLVLAAFVLCVVVTLSEGRRRKLDDIARWALDEIGPGYQFINVKRIRVKNMDGTLYHLKVKARKNIYGGVSEVHKCNVKVIVIDDRKILKHYVCFKAGGGRDDWMGSSN